ncbi:MAG: hypothetical protein ORN58_03435, partial [Sediminibacterium sp.]|nr:hypothetical protein [Sediminibacterium sp.]
MKLSKVIFWEIDFDTLDLDKYKFYVIERVLMYGFFSDWQFIRSYYGDEEIKKTALQIRDLDPNTLPFLSVIFEILKEQFRCYTTELLNQI